MIIIKFESWWVERGRCLFDEKRQGGAKMGWDVLAIKLTADDGTEGVATCMAARSGGVTENYLHDSIAPVVLGRDPHDREAIFYELWNVDRHEAFFPVFLPGPVMWRCGYVRKSCRSASAQIHRFLPQPAAGLCQRQFPQHRAGICGRGPVL